MNSILYWNHWILSLCGCVVWTAGSLNSCDSFLNIFQNKGLRREAICPSASSVEATTISIRRSALTVPFIRQNICTFKLWKICYPCLVVLRNPAFIDLYVWHCKFQAWPDRSECLRARYPVDAGTQLWSGPGGHSEQSDVIDSTGLRTGAAWR